VIRKSDGQTVGEYTYDSMNRRFRKMVSNNGTEGDATNGTTEYFYKDWQVVEEQDGSDNIERQYVYGRYIDEPLTLDDRSDGQTVSDLNDGSGDDRLFYHCNTQYSTFALTDEMGAIVEGYQHDAYGRQTVITDPGSDGEWFTDDDTLEVNGDSEVHNPYMFQGRRFDLESGMYFYRNRYYNARLGRFISRDPMGIWYDEFSYGNGYPITSIDPYGLNGWSQAWESAKNISWGAWEGTKEVVTEPFKAGSDVITAGYARTAGIKLENVHFASSSARSTKRRMISGQSRAEAVLKGEGEFAANLGSLGLYSQAKSVYLYSKGEIGVSQVEHQLGAVAGPNAIFLGTVGVKKVATIRSRKARASTSYTESAVQYQKLKQQLALQEKFGPKNVSIVSRWGRPGLRTGSWVMTGEANVWNYIFSGKYQPKRFPGRNRPAAFWSGEEFVVPTKALKCPPGWEKLKFWQRVYNKNK